MTNKEKCAVAVLTTAFIDASTEKGVAVINDTLDSLLITSVELKEFVHQFTSNGGTRFQLYNDIRKLSSKDKELVRGVVYHAYSEGGRQGTNHAVFYFKEIIIECGLANVVI